MKIINSIVRGESATVNYVLVYKDSSTASRSVLLTKEDSVWKMGLIPSDPTASLNSRQMVSPTPPSPLPTATVLPSPPVSDSSSDSGKLTNPKAQNALNSWIGSRGSVNVLGVREMPQTNEAKVDFTVSNYQYRNYYNREQVYSGKGEADFTHYNDGRWVLMGARIFDRWYNYWGKLNIEAK